MNKGFLFAALLLVLTVNDVMAKEVTPYSTWIGVVQGAAVASEVYGLPFTEQAMDHVRETFFELWDDPINQLDWLSMDTSRMEYRIGYGCGQGAVLFLVHAEFVTYDQMNANPAILDMILENIGFQCIVNSENQIEKKLSSINR